MNAFKMFTLSKNANLYTTIYYNKPRILKTGHTNNFTDNKNNSKYEFSKGKLGKHKYLKGIMYGWKIKVI